MTKTTLDAKYFVDHCNRNGVSISIRGSVVSLSKSFDPNSMDGYSDAESICSIIYEVPYRDGSIWGTTGDTIGGAVALQSGHHKINVSGVSKRFISKLVKLL